MEVDVEIYWMGKMERVEFNKKQGSVRSARVLLVVFPPRFIELNLPVVLLN